MRVFMTGATGFVGRALALRLRRDGHEIRAWVRDEARAGGLLGAEAGLVSTGAPRAALVDALAGCDAVVNLAGESVVGARWTSSRKASLVESRVGVTARMVDAMRDAARPRVLVSASAVGFYGDRGDESLDEHSGAGAGFLADLCREWEKAARQAEAGGVRVVIPRIGVVMGREGGALDKLLPPFRAGVGGRVGTGRQYVSWIHLHDLVEILAAALTDERMEGPINAVAPGVVTNRELTHELGRALHRWTPIPVPGPALHLAFGEGATALFDSQRVVPRRLLDLGFRFQYPSLDTALEDTIDTSSVEIRRLPEAGRGVHVLRTTARVKAPLGEVFGFFSQPSNLGVMTPPRMRFRILEAPPTLAQGAEIDYLIRIGPSDVSWRTRIDRWEPGVGFVDSQIAGPYRSWRHSHAFRAAGPAETIMEDHVEYAAPFGVLGRAAGRFFVAPELRRIFAFRRDVVRLRFGLDAG